MAGSNPRLGYHYYPDDRHFRHEDLQTWLPILQSLGASWLTLKAGILRAIPEHFIRGLLDAGIEPIIHMAHKVGSIRPSEIVPLLESYARWGVRYVVVYDRPNMKGSWEDPAWGRPGLVERFIDHMLPILKAERSAGLKPVLPPLEPGGNYWDTSFLASALKSLRRRGLQDLIGQLSLGIYCWAFNRPLEWGKGGPEHWGEAKPYHTPQGCQDQIGFYLGDWYAAISDDALQTVLPMIVIAGGAVPSKVKKLPFRPDPHLERNLSIARLLETGEIHPQIQNFAYYLLAAEGGDPEFGKTWFPAPDLPLPVVKAMQEYVESLSKRSGPVTYKPLEHYVLLPTNSATDFDRRWEAIGELVSKAQPVVGFSSQEARLARKVTLVGDESDIPEGVANMLRAAGSSVQRIPRNILDTVIRQRSRRKSKVPDNA